MVVALWRGRAGRRLLAGAALFLCAVGAAFPAFLDQWDRAGAERAWEEAVRLRKELDSTTEPSRESYLNCLKTFRLVYLRDPHFGMSDDAIYEEGRLYQELGERFGDPGDYRNAVRLFSFLVSDYAASPYCPDALLRTGELQAGPLKNRAEADKAYRKLRTTYKSSEAAALVGARLKAGRLPPAAEPAAAVTARKTSAPAAVPVTRAGPAVLRNIRHWATENYTRVIIDLDNVADFTSTRLKNPERVFFDIEDTSLADGMRNRTIPVEDDYLKQVRVGQNRPRVARVVLDFDAFHEISVSRLYDPFRIVLDIRGKREAAQVAAKPQRPGDVRPDERDDNPGRPPEAPKPPPAAVAGQLKPGPAAGRVVEPSSSGKDAPAASPPETVTEGPQPVPPSSTIKSEASGLSTPVRGPLVLPRPAEPTTEGNRTMTRMLGLKLSRIVLDPGHGGSDNGTVGPGGLAEKDLVLEVARELKKLLQSQLGAEVILTRNDDSYVPLEERTAMANRYHADLFLSIHANSGRQRNVSGVETYFLDFARTAEASEVAARENAVTDGNIRDLQSLVTKIAQADKMDESRELAAIIQRNLYSQARKIFPSTRNRGVRSAPFVVLIGANMPSVLAEVAFISNPRDEKILKKENSRQGLATALFEGIEVYMKTLGSDVALSRSNPN